MYWILLVVNAWRQLNVVAPEALLKSLYIYTLEHNVRETEVV